MGFAFQMMCGRYAKSINIYFLSKLHQSSELHVFQFLFNVVFFSEKSYNFLC